MKKVLFAGILSGLLNYNCQAQVWISEEIHTPNDCFFVSMEMTNNLGYIAFQDYTNGFDSKGWIYGNAGDWLPVGGSNLPHDVIFGIDVALTSEYLRPMVAFQDFDRSNDIYVGYRENDAWGDPWAELGTGITSTYTNYPDIEVDPSTDYAYVALNHSQSQARVAVNEGSGWLYTDESLGASDGTLDLELYPSGNTNNLFVVFTSSTGIVLKARPFNDPDGWETIGVNVASSGSDPSLSLGPDGTPFVAFKDGNQSNKLTVKYFDGSSWIALGSEGITPGAIKQLEIVVDKWGLPFVAYIDDSDNSLNLMMYDALGETPGWIDVSADLPISTAKAFDFEITNDGVLHIAAYNTTTGKIEYVSHDRAAQSIPSFSLGSQLKYGESDDFNQSNTSQGLPLLYTSEDESILSISGLTATATGVGQVNVVASNPGNFEYIGVSRSSSITTLKNIQVITFDPLPDKTFGDDPFMISATSNRGIPMNFYSTPHADVVLVQDGIVTIQGAGTVEITIGNNGNEFYEGARATQELIVHKANQTITFDPLPTKSEGDPAFLIEASSTSNLIVAFSSSNTDVATIEGQVVTIHGTGATTITASQNGNDDYNAAPSVNRTLTVLAEQTISFETIPSLSVLDDSHTLNATSDSGLPVAFESSNPAIASISGNNLMINEPGEVTIRAIQGGNGSYSPAHESQTVIIKDSQEISFEPLSDEPYFASEIIDLVAATTSNLPVELVVLSGPAVISERQLSFTGPGDVTIEARQSGNEFYLAAEPVSQSISAIKMEQSITFETLDDGPYPAAQPLELIATSTSELPVEFAVISGPAVISGGMLTFSSTGEVTVEASQTGNSIYQPASPVQQTIEVIKSNQTITFETNLSVLHVGDQFNLEASASSGLSISYTSSNTQVATIDGTLLTVVSAGTSLITASQSGNEIYNEAESITHTLEATEPLGILPNQKIHLFPNPATNYLKIEGNNSLFTKAILLSLTGSVLHEWSLNTETKISLPSDLGSGVYLLQIMDSKGHKSTHRFLKQ